MILYSLSCYSDEKELILALGASLGIQQTVTQKPLENYG